MPSKAFILLAVIAAASVLLPVINGQACVSCAAGEIVLDQTGGYTKVLVYVEPKVTYEASIITKLEEYLNLLSQALFTATSKYKSRYIKDVTVLVPESWPQDSRFRYATTESAEYAAFRVANDGKAWKSNPHTERVDLTCGSEGEYIVLPKSYLTDAAEVIKFGDIGKALTHEWAHYRYGVFDESDWENGGLGDKIGCNPNDEDGQYVIPKCVDDINGTLVTISQAGYCIFIPNIHQPSYIDSSLMYAPYIDSVNTFCDDDNHNFEAANSQNTLCNYQSVWAILKAHKDFDNSIPAAVSAPPIKFTYVQENILRIAIIMDISGSMAGDRLLAMQVAVEDFLISLYNRSQSTGQQVMVAMVEFSTSSSILHPLVTLTSSTLDTLIDAIPPTTEGSTCIGCGILKGIQALGTCGRRGQLYVFTDGEENVAPYIQDVDDDVCACNATVYGILFSTVADSHPLITLADETCGSSCIYDDSLYTTMYECLWAATAKAAPGLAPTQIAGYVTEVAARSSLNANVVIDASLSTNVTFRFLWPSSQALQYRVFRSTAREVDKYAFDSKKALAAKANRCDQINVVLTTPDGEIIQEGSPNYQADGLSIDIIASSKTFGSWNYVIDNPSSYICDVRVTIDSSSPNDVDIIEMSYKIPKVSVKLDPANTPEENSIPLFVTLRKGTIPVGNARVVAQITRGSSLWNLELKDNGAGADFLVNDGTYSRYFTEFDADGTYSIQFRAEGVAGEVTLIQDERTYGSGAPPLPEYRVYMTTTASQAEAFQRSEAGGYVEISGYSSLPPNMYPPSKITDLEAFPEPIALYDATVNVTWTATGDNLDKGVASSYDLRISNTSTDLSMKFDSSTRVTPSMIKVGDLNSPLPSGERELFILDLVGTGYDKLNTPFYMAIKAINSDGTASSVSNIATYTLSPPPACPPEEGGINCRRK